MVPTVSAGDLPYGGFWGEVQINTEGTAMPQGYSQAFMMSFKSSGCQGAEKC